MLFPSSQAPTTSDPTTIAWSWWVSNLLKASCGRSWGECRIQLHDQET